MAVNGGPTNPTAPGGGGQPSVSALVTINSDVQPVWETEALPDWVVNWLIPMLSAGQKWPEASESGLSKLAHAYGDLGTTAVGSTQDAGTAARTVATGWNSPSTAEFVSRAQVLYGNEGGLAGVSANAHAYGQQANNFAVETQYSKLSINVAFWVTVVAIAIALVAAFFSAGSTTAIIGPYAAAARAAISRILVRLATVGGRSLTASRLARVTTLSGATGRGVIARLLATSLGRELVEEIGEEFFIDAVAQYQQIRMGTRQEWDWKKSQAAVIGAGAGAVIGTRLSGPVSRVTGSVPGFAGRALTTGATNMIASPVGSFFANGAVYGQWQNPFTAESMMGGFLGGAGRAGSISPFNPDVYSALANPVSTLASAYDSAARTDAARSPGGDPPGPAAGNPSNGTPDPDGAPGSARTAEPARAGAPAANGGTTRPAGNPDTGRPDTDPATQRRASAPAEPGDRNQPDARTDRTARTTATSDTTPGQDSTAEPTGESAPTATPDAQPQGEPARTADPTAQNPSGTTQNPGEATQNPGDTSQTTQNPGETSQTAQNPGEPAQNPENPADQTAQGDVRADGMPTTEGTPDTTTPRAPEDTTVTADGATTTPANPAQAAGPAPTATTGQDPAAGAYTSKPGTVTSRPIPGTRYVTDGRQGPDLTLAEVRAATDELLTKYFLDGTVTGLTWSQDGTTLAVHTTDGTHYFRPVVDRRSKRDEMARTRVRNDSDENRPHKVSFNPRVAGDQLSRVWLHEITDTLQRLRADRLPVLRRPDPEQARRDACVDARLNEMAMLADKWDNAPTMPEKRLLALDIDGVARALRDSKHTPPLPPWAPKQGTRRQHTPPLPEGRPSAEEVASIIDTLTKAEQDLQVQVTALRASAAEEREQALNSTQEARKALRQHDSGRFERARAARKEHVLHRAAQRRHLRIAKAYESALTRATESRQSYEQLLSALQQAPRPNHRGEPGPAKSARRIEALARRRHLSYLNTMTMALPQQAALGTAMPAGTLAHLTALTTTVNELLERNGARHRFTPDELERAVRADFHRIVSPDGLVLRLGHGSTAAEIRLKLTLSDLFEVLDSGVKASEMMVGLFFQAARTVSATQSSSGGMSGGFDTSVLAKLMPEGEWYRTLTQVLGVSIGGAGGRGNSTTGGAGMYAQGGSVADNRSESLLFDAAARWTVEIRTGRETAWRGTTVVDTGAPGDPGSQRLWISHSYADQRPSKLVRIPEHQRDPKLPNLVVSEMTGLEDAFDAIAQELGGDYAKIGEVSRGNLHGFVTSELPHRLRDAVNTGIERVFTVDGRPHARVRAESRIVLVTAEPLGGATSEEWEEEVLVDFVSAPGGVSSNRSLGGDLSAGLRINALEDVDGPGDYGPTIGPKVKGAVGGSRSYSSTGNKQTIHPGVHRKTKRKQAHQFAVETTFTVERFGKPPITLPTTRSMVTASMRESAAYRFGLPVDRHALKYRNGEPVTDADGNAVLRGDPDPDPPPGRKAELPSFLGDGPGQMRGAGPALVQDIEGLDAFRQKVLDQLAERGLVPKTVNGKPKYAFGELARAAQILNLQEVTEQLSEHRIRSAYDSLAQDGIVFDLVQLGVNSAPEHFSLKISLKQDFAGGVTYVGHTDSETVVNLEISSDTSAWAAGRSRNGGGGLSVGVSDGPPEGHDGTTHEVAGKYDYQNTLTIGSSSGNTDNEVLLHETKGPVSIFLLEGDLTAELLHGKKSTVLASDEITAKLLFAADLLPPDTATPPAPLGKVSAEAQAKMKLLYLDVPGRMDAAREVLPRATRRSSPAFQKIFSMLNVRNLISHVKLLTRPIVTDTVVRADGIPLRSSLSVSGELGESEVVAVVDQVSGDILFGLGSAGVSWGGSSGHTIGGSGKLGDLDDAGQTGDSATLGAPARFRGSSTSASVLDIWGTEELLIEFGRQYIIKSSVDLTLTGSESAMPGLPIAEQIGLGGTKTAGAAGTALFSIPEYDALVLYSAGKLNLPAHLVSDAIERLLNGSLDLDATVAVPLAQKYLKDVAQARNTGQDVGYADRHTPAALLDKMHELTGLGPAPGSPSNEAEQRLQDVLSEAADLIERSRSIVVAPSFEGATGMGLVESVVMTDEQGEVVPAADAVVAAIRAQAPDVLAQRPNMRDQLDTDFSDNAIRIHIDDAWSPRGFEKTYGLHTDITQTRPAEELTVRYRLLPMNPEGLRQAEALTHSSLSGIIKQHYLYSEHNRSQSRAGSQAAGLDYGGSDHGDGQGVGLSSDRGYSFSHSNTETGVRLNRLGLFIGNDRIRQGMIAVVQVSRNAVGAEPVFGPPVVLPAAVTRRLPSGMIMPADQDPGPVSTVRDPRLAELRSGLFPEALWEDPVKPDLFQVINQQLSKMIGAKAVRESRAQLVKRLSRSALLPAFERMSGPVGNVIRVASMRFKNQGARVTIHARTSDLTVIAGPFEAEKGQVDRKAEAQNVSISRSRVLPVGVSAGESDGDSGLNGGVRGGEQASESVNDHHGARRERSSFEQAKLFIVRLRVDYDLTFENVARRPDQEERAVGDPVHMTGAASGWADVVLTQQELEEIISRMESNVRLAPASDPGTRPFMFVPGPGRHGLIQVVQDARLAARERGIPARVRVRDAVGMHEYVASPDGSLRSAKPDGGFAEAFATLSPALLEAADNVRLDLRDVFMNSPVPGSFVRQVTHALNEHGVFAVDVGKPVWPADVRKSHAPVGGSVAQGWSGGGAPSPALANTIFDRAGRPDGDPDLDLAEVRAQDLSAGDLGGAAAHLSWTSGDLLTVQFPAAPDQHVRVLIEDPGADLNGATEVRAGTPEEPHLVRLWQRIHPDVVSSVLVHELSHVAQAVSAAAAGAPQGVIRPSPQAHEGDDLCLVPRLDEHTHLARKWRAATDPDTRSGLADAIDAIAADLEQRGHTPPPPWGTGSRTAAPEQQSRIARLLNGGPAVDPLAAGGRPALPEAAAAAAVQRAAAHLGGRVHAPSPGVLDILLPGHPSVRVEVRPAAAPSSGQPSGQHVVTYQVDGRLTIGANERAAAATTARAIAQARGQAAADHAALAELNEAVRQVRAATAAQRPGRLGTLFDLVSATRPEVLRLLSAPVAAELATLANGARPRDWPAHLQRLRTLANATGWYPPEWECRCPEDEPCTCGRGAGAQAPADAPREPAGAVRA
ncbi:hypothetical protein [Nonomuraea ferruginea]|uniref:Outer membrane channel protein CpnT-like N-terminal domain-containing protein n=2 Tax=Nonomuraea ferruginea TaxID=46174 RepID=A0ABT4SRX6_9ACTN|nr:hypothetical protein [Nonomuraea ferruginea]MDA0640014.1 hypothetical protein [Nonomuraea ferruginea]